MKYKIGMTIGRFQHVHTGHESMINITQLVCEKVYIFVGSAQESGTRRNPFSAATRIEMLKEIYKDSENVHILPLNDLSHEGNNTPSWGKYLLNHCQNTFGQNPDVMVYGNDDSRSNWYAKEDIRDVTEIIVNRNAINISATELRLLLLLNLRKEWEKWVNPCLYKFYDRLRAELLEVPYYKELLTYIHAIIGYSFNPQTSGDLENLIRCVKSIINLKDCQDNLDKDFKQYIQERLGTNELNFHNFLWDCVPKSEVGRDKGFKIEPAINQEVKPFLGAYETDQVSDISHQEF